MDKTNAHIAFQSEVQKVVVEMEDMTDFMIKKEPVEEDTEIDDDSLLWSAIVIVAKMIDENQRNYFDYFVVFVVLFQLISHDS